MSEAALALLAAVLAAVGAALAVSGRSDGRLRSAVAPRPTARPTGGERVSSVVGAVRRRARRRGSGERARRLALEVCDALAAELAAGRAVRDALLAAVAAGPGARHPCPAAAAACRLGGDVPAALRHDAATSGLRLWASLAACWQVGEGSGAGLAAAVDRLVVGARADEEVRREIAAALAAPRATARVLAFLPVVGLGLGTAVGARPVAWLTGSAVGLLVLAAGVAFAAVGVAWTAALARSVERRL
jgi:tight adherence protein B